MKILAENRKARFDYFIKDKFEAGLALQGWEVKSAKAAELSLAESFIHFTEDTRELWLKNAYIAPYKEGDVPNQETRRNRKLLLNRSEIEKIAKGILIKGNSCVPLKIYLHQNGLIKMEIAIATGKHTYDKKQTLKQRDLAREVNKIL